MSDEGRSVRLTIPAKPEYITGPADPDRACRVRPVSDETLHDLKLALTEACTNSVQHAYQDGRVGTVEILYELEPDRLAVEVADQPGVRGGRGRGRRRWGRARRAGSVSRSSVRSPTRSRSAPATTAAHASAS
jgi:hypothetical protein